LSNEASVPKKIKCFQTSYQTIVKRIQKKIVKISKKKELFLVTCKSLESTVSHGLPKMFGRWEVEEANAEAIYT
jgi:hypothetical protein